MSDNYPLLKRSTNKRVLNIILKNSKNDLEIKIIHDILDIAYQNNVFFACYKDDFDNIVINISGNEENLKKFESEYKQNVI